MLPMELCSKVISHWSAHLEVASLLSHLHPELSKRLHFLETKFLPSNIGVNYIYMLARCRQVSSTPSGLLAALCAFLAGEEDLGTWTGSWAAILTRWSRCQNVLSLDTYNETIITRHKMKIKMLTKHWEICAENLFVQKRLNSTSFLASVRTVVRDQVQEVIHGATTMVKTRYITIWQNAETWDIGLFIYLFGCLLWFQSDIAVVLSAYQHYIAPKSWASPLGIPSMFHDKSKTDNSRATHQTPTSICAPRYSDWHFLKRSVSLSWHLGMVLFELYRCTIYRIDIMYYIHRY